MLTANFERRLGRFKAAAKRLADLPENKLGPGNAYFRRLLEVLRQYVYDHNAKPQLLPPQKSR
jgi:hypothetical protein